MTDTRWLELALAVVLLLWGASSAALLTGFLRERARRRAAERQTQALQRERDQELAGLGSLLEESYQRERRELDLVARLWKQLGQLCGTALVLKERYKEQKSGRAREAVWLNYYKDEDIKELESLVNRILTRWAQDKRAHARESLIQELVGAVLHFFFPGKVPVLK